MTNKEKVIQGQAERERLREEEYDRKKMEYEASLRATGRTTRLIDDYVQELFKRGEVILRDHHENGEGYRANGILTIKFKDRMRLEHKSVEVKYNTIGNATTAKIEPKIFFK